MSVKVWWHGRIAHFGGEVFSGPKFTEEEIEAELISYGAEFKKFEDLGFIEQLTSDLANQKAIGWMQGRMEFGPRALGARSIIADPRSPSMQKQLNLKVIYIEKSSSHLLQVF